MMTTSTEFDAMLPKGFRDFLPVKAAKIEYLKSTILDIFSRWGFRPILPPSLEFLPVLEKGLGSGLAEKAFRFDDRQSGKLVAFPPDITPQVARIVATRMRDIPMPMRLSYSGRVMRHTEQQAGKDREIYQAGVELIGLESPEADAEMIAMSIGALKALGATEFTMDVGQVEFFRGVMSNLSLTGAQAQNVQSAIARKDSSGLRTLLENLPIGDRNREEILALPRLFGGREVLVRADKVVTNDRSRRALENLHQVLEILEVYGVEDHVTFDLGELRGLDYNTGITFQGFLTGIGRAVCSGGRYDNLTARYGMPAPATGFAFNLLNLLFALDKDLNQMAVQSTDVLVFQKGADKKPAQKVARALREQGYSASRDIISRNLDDSMLYAKRMNYRFVMIIETEQGEIQLLHVGNGKQRALPYEAVFSPDFSL